MGAQCSGAGDVVAGFEQATAYEGADVVGYLGGDRVGAGAVESYGEVGHEVGAHRSIVMCKSGLSQHA
ncbi:hypothetical protein BHF78_11370 [Corynebacterium diphtheriae]|nr:hypothetical protein BHF73_11260 [Corynebacterium diphtheriae]OIR65332.1 hypothetical protein BHF76_10955 [Corynebacterium diphtheriae]OIR71311.1 hypothetical protein BHF78_11370 [Corynebacterium diphtheriae]OIR83009.1 hypothetical protein BHF85_11215 [Corynebacterium diphtheriae]OIR84575.1 hypothetical protein BHF86_10720 [Corynebacterium diphtheriae]